MGNRFLDLYKIPTFVTNKLELRETTILQYIGLFGKETINYNLNRNGKNTLTKKELEKYINYLGVKNSEHYTSALIFTPTEIIQIKIIDNQQQKKIVKEFGSPNNYRIRIAEIFYHGDLGIESLLEKFNIHKVEFIVYKKFLQNKEMQEIMKFLIDWKQSNPKTEKKLDQLVSNMELKGGSDYLFKLIHYQMEEKFSKNQGSIWTKQFFLLKSIMEDLEFAEILFYIYFLEKADLFLEENIASITSLINKLVLQYHFLQIPEVSATSFKQIYLLLQRAIDLEYQSPIPSYGLANLYNTLFSIIFEIEKFNEIAKYYLILTIHQYISKIRYIELTESEMIRFSNIMNNYYNNQISNNFSGKALQGKIDNINLDNSSIEAEIKRFKKKNIISNNNSHYSHYHLFEILYRYKMMNLVQQISVEEKQLNDAYDFIEGLYKTENDNFVDIFTIFLSHYLINYLLNNSRIDPGKDSFEVYKKIKKRYEDRGSEDKRGKLFNKLKQQRNEFKGIQENEEFWKIRYQLDGINLQLEEFINYFANEENQYNEHLLAGKRVHTLWHIISHIDEADPVLIHQLLDILELRATTRYNLSRLLIQLIRAYLNREDVDDITKFYVSNYIDLPVDDDFTEVNKELLQDLADICFEQSRNEITVDYDTLVVKMEQQLGDKSRSDDIEDQEDRPPLIPLDLYLLFDDTDRVPEYWRFYFAFHDALRKLKQGEDPKKIFQHLLNTRAYQDNLQPYMEKITELSHEYEDVVDNISMELLKIRVTAEYLPVESMMKLDHYMETLQSMKPHIRHYREIIELYYHLAGKLDFDLPYHVVWLEQVLNLYEENYRGINICEYMTAVSRIKTQDYRTVVRQIPLADLVGFQITHEMRNREQILNELAIRMDNPLLQLMNELERGDVHEVDLLNQAMESLRKYDPQVVTVIDRPAEILPYWYGVSKLKILQYIIIPSEDSLVELVQEKEVSRYYRIRIMLLVLEYFAEKYQFDRGNMVVDEIIRLVQTSPYQKQFDKLIPGIIRYATVFARQEIKPVLSSITDASMEESWLEEQSKDIAVLDQNQEEGAIHPELVNLFEIDDHDILEEMF